MSTVAAWTALCMQCAPNVHPATTIAIVKVESCGNPYAINDNSTKKSYAPKSKQEAILLAYSLLKKGHSIDMGLMQVNSAHLKNANFQYYDLFDPCFNMYKGSQILSEFYRKYDLPNQNPQTTLLKALSSYNTGNPFKGYYNGYVSKILKNTNSAFVYFNPNNYNEPKVPVPARVNELTAQYHAIDNTDTSPKVYEVVQGSQDSEDSQNQLISSSAPESMSFSSRSLADRSNSLSISSEPSSPASLTSNTITPQTTK